eukprot:TRINITY_DN2523_c0_g1_i3.p1 TRINITY_DN2523_c0_g1~~TRINITY_DN2523_c0_g1_i3.p1  ORF type:complete len:184 (-),score=45.65 TRINITY_DN2523_c0_g1_i3:441-992(-)
MESVQILCSGLAFDVKEKLKLIAQEYFYKRKEVPVKEAAKKIVKILPPEILLKFMLVFYEQGITYETLKHNGFYDSKSQKKKKKKLNPIQIQENKEFNVKIKDKKNKKTGSGFKSKRSKSLKFNKSHDRALLDYCRKYPGKWSKISTMINNDFNTEFTGNQLAQRVGRVLNPNRRVGPFSPGD